MTRPRRPSMKRSPSRWLLALFFISAFPLPRQRRGNHAVGYLDTGRPSSSAACARSPVAPACCGMSHVAGGVWIDRVVSGPAAGQCPDAVGCVGCACIDLVPDAAVDTCAAADIVDRVGPARNPFARGLKSSRAWMVLDQWHNIEACQLTESGTAPHPAVPWRRHRGRPGSRPCPASGRTRS